jgi:WD40 repeat protein
MRGHLQNVESVAVSPDERIFMSVSKDSTVRFYDIDDQRMIDCQYVFKPARSSAFWSERTPAGVVAKIVMKDNSTIPMCCAIGHEDGSFSVWKTDKTAAEAKAQEQFNQAPENMDKASCDPFFNPEDAFGGIHLLCSNPLPRPAPVPGMGISGARAPSEQALSIQYSPNGKYCVVALGDNCLDIYKHDIKLKEVQPSRNIMKEDSKQKALGMSDEEIERQTALPYQRVGCCNDHSSAVQCVDFDSESLYMRSVSQSRELLFAFIPSGKQCLKTEELSKKKWETHNCVLGWSVKSIWARGSQGDDVNSIDRTKDKVPPWAPCHGGKHPSPYPYPEGVGPNGSARPTDQMKTKNFPGEGDLSSWGHYVCATGDDFGKIKLFRWPAFGFKQAFRSYLGHGSHVMQVRFSYDDDYLMSAGGSDMSCFQWRHVIPNKIYVQNLPDAKNQDGTYKLPNHEMCEILKNFFSRFLKFDRDKEVTRTTNKDDALEEKLKKTMDFLGELSDKEKTRLRNLVYLQKEAWVGLNEKEEKKIPDREIVSVRVFNTGAKWEGKEFPSDKKGSKITSRWATVVFQSKDDVDDVIDVYGADLAFNYEKLFEEELCMLHPLYVEGAEAPDEKSIEYNREDPQDVVRLSKEKNPVNPGQNIYRTWKPLYKESDPKFKYQETSQHPPFLCITGYDPNESTMTTVVHNSMYKIAQDFKKRYEKSSEVQSLSAVPFVSILCMVFLQVHLVYVLAGLELGEDQRALEGRGIGVAAYTRVDSIG